MGNFCKNFLKLFDFEIESLINKDLNIFKAKELDYSNLITNNNDNLISKLHKISDIYENNKFEIIKNIGFDPIQDSEYTYIQRRFIINNYLMFLQNGCLMYKFNDDFLNDFLNYPLNIEDYILSNKISLNNDSFCIYAKDIYNLEHNNNKYNYNLIYVSKMTILNNGVRKNIYRFTLKDINKNYGNMYHFFRETDVNFSLESIFKINNILSNNNEDQNINLELAKKIIKLIIYIQSSNVDLREIKTEVPKNDTRKERDRATTINNINDSLISYYNVGYSWNKLPIYTQDQWSVIGHFRLQPCGQNRQNHKIIFIEPQIRTRQSSKNIELSSNIAQI
ncbi:hypothetical protein GCL60_16310 [Silvanigrella paludirubra]|uniref:Uncharacterized protein n=1 Tax=Silvanigrella paludirubra TaxID=2499159 RepID=A0A6N6VTL2_9BACT|nr:hypothetical protein [Silvanigrella paludirubra]KAB8035791.1 hypothetical protein GCL60_16310 [Silvanigrella paludirubra]